MTRKYLTRPAAIAIVALLVVGSLAYAAWTVNGSGTGSASAASAVNLALTPGSPSDALYPGAAGDVATSIANPNPFPVHVTSISLDSGQGSGGFAVDGGHSACNINTLSFSAQTNGGSGWDIPANGSIDVDAADAIAMGSGANDSCQGAAFTVYLTASAVSA
jgi:hypothetical protein